MFVYYIPEVDQLLLSPYACAYFMVNSFREKEMRKCLAFFIGEL